MADDVQVVFSAQIGQLIDAVSEVKGAIESIGGTVEEVTGLLKGFSEAFGAAFVIDKVDEFFDHFAELATQTQRNAALLGVSTDQIAGLNNAARASGSNIDSLAGAMARLGASLANADAGSLKAKGGLDALGISVKQFQGLSPQQQLETLAEKFSVLKDGIDKDAIAMAVMGRAGAQMIPLLNQGAAGLRDFQEMAERTGSVMDSKTAAAFDATGRSLIEMRDSFTGLGMTIASIFKPAFDGIVKVVTDAVQGFNNAARSGGDVRIMLDTLGVAGRTFATAIAVAVGALETLWTTGKAVATALANDFRDLGKIMYSAMTLDMGGIQSAWADLMASQRKAAQGAATEMSGVMRNLMTELKVIWGQGAQAQVEIEQNKAARLIVANRDVVAAAIAAAQEQIKIGDMQYAQQVERINSAAKQMQITEDQKTQFLLGALDQRYSAELAALAQESAIQGLSKAQYQKILNDQEQLDQKYVQDRQRLIDQAAEREAQIWSTAADQVAGAFNSQLRGLLAGTTSWTQALKGAFADLTLKLIEDGDKWALEWIAQQLRVALFGNALKTTDVTTTAATEAAKTTAVTAGVSARAAAESTGATTGLIAQIGNAVAVISADAAKTFAGVFAFLSPTMGPAAAGPATAAAATVEASAAGVAVPGLSVGTDYVLSEGLAYLHSGEQVVPAQTSGPYTGANAGGGGQQVIFSPNLSAFNPSGLQQLLVSIMPQLARELNRYQGLNPSLTGG